MEYNELEGRNIFKAGLNNFISLNKSLILDGRQLKILIPK
jgi:hypothetical protein